MRALRNAILTAMIFFPLSVALVAPASAVAGAAPSAALAARPAVPYAPFPSCGDAFTLFRGGDLVRIVAGASSLSRFGKGIMYVYVAADGESFGPYGASSTGGASFQIRTASSKATTIAISLTNESGTTLCAQDYYA